MTVLDGGSVLPAPPGGRQGRALRVLHVAQPVAGGVAQCVADLVAEQRAAGWRALVACPDPGDGVLAPLSPLRWEAARDPGPSVLPEVRDLRRLVDAVAPDVVHLHSSKAGLAGRLALRGRVLTVFQPHAWSFEAVAGPVRLGTRAWERTGARWADRVLCVSEAERRAGLAAGIGGEHVVVVNGVDLSRHAPREAPAARAALGLAEAPTVVCVGRLARQKGQDVLLAAWPAVRAAVPAARLVLVGDGPEEPALRTAAAGLDGVQLIGSRADTAAWTAAADVVAVPSRWEAMALVVLEAMAGGRSVVAADVGAARECLAPAAAGALVPPEDPRALADALVARLSAPGLAVEEGRRGRAEAEARFDVRVTTAAVRELYAGLLRQH